MMRMHTIAAFALLILFTVTGSASAQAPDLETYATSHLFALPSATTTRLFGMGGFVTCIPDDGFGNPAFAGILHSSHAVARCSSTSFDSGLKLRSQQYSAAIPLQPDKRGMQITGMRLTSTAAPPVGLLGAPAIGFKEWDLAIHYGQRVSDRWTAGISVSPVFHSSTDFVLPGPPGRVAHIRSTVDDGYRLGAAYQLDNDGWAGIVYDKYREKLTAGGPAFGAAPVQARFSSEAIILGVSHRLHERVLGAVEWQRLTTRGPAVRVSESGFRVGVEALATDRCQVRLGINDGAFSAGAGYEGGDWAVEYAFINNWNDDIVGAAFGGSDTHQLEVKYRW